jgi:hypothetical protein
MIKLFCVGLQDVRLRWRDDLEAKPALGVDQRPHEADPQIVLHHGHVLPRPLDVHQLVVLEGS